MSKQVWLVIHRHRHGEDFWALNSEKEAFAQAEAIKADDLNREDFACGNDSVEVLLLPVEPSPQVDGGER